MENQIKKCLADLARLRRIELNPGWSEGVEEFDDTSADGLAHFVAQVGWPTQVVLRYEPRAQEFPMMVHHPDMGWAVAVRMEGTTKLSILRNGEKDIWSLDNDTALYDVALPEPPGEKHFDKAIDVFKSAISKRKTPIILAIIATFTVNMIALGTSLYAMQVYDRVIPRGAFATLWVLTVALVVAIGFDLLLRVIRARLLEREAMSIDSETSEYFFARAADVRLDARPPAVGTMASQMRGLEQIRSTLSSSVIFGAADLPFAIFFIFVIFQLGGKIALVTLVSFPIAVAIAFLLGRLIRENTRKAQVNSNKKNGLLVESIDASEIIKSNRGQWFFLKKWNGLIDEIHRSDWPVRNTQSIAGAIFGSLQQLAYVGIIAWGAIQVYEREMTQGGLIACAILAGRINGPLINQLPNMIVNWTYTKISLSMLDAIMALPSDKARGIEVLRPNFLAGAVTFKDVEFTHPGARIGIKIPSLEIKAGERVGLMGPVGSGKSTMLRLASGLYAPSEGRVMVDGLDIATVAEDVLRNHIGYLPQDYRLVNGTLRDNLLLGLADPGDDALMHAAEATGLSRLIASHPQGVDLPIGEGGRGLSGGQRTLTGLTRLMLAQPSVWLLDEPTSNLDAQTEAHLLKALEAAIPENATVLMVSHKPQLLKSVDRIIVIMDGAVTMDGPKDEILAKLSRPPQRQPVPAAIRTVPVGGRA